MFILSCKFCNFCDSHFLEVGNYMLCPIHEEQDIVLFQRRTLVPDCFSIIKVLYIPQKSPSKSQYGLGLLINSYHDLSGWNLDCVAKELGL